MNLAFLLTIYLHFSFKNSIVSMLVASRNKKKYIKINTFEYFLLFFVIWAGKLMVAKRFEYVQACGFLCQIILVYWRMLIDWMHDILEWLQYPLHKLFFKKFSDQFIIFFKCISLSFMLINSQWNIDICLDTLVYWFISVFHNIICFQL